MKNEEKKAIQRQISIKVIKYKKSQWWIDGHDSINNIDAGRLS